MGPGSTLVPMPGRGARACAHLVALGLLAAACSGPAAASAPRAAAGPAGLAGSTPAGAPGASCGDPTASLRPDAALPPPGAMPAGSFVRLVQDRGRLVAGVSGDRMLFGALDPLTNLLVGFEVDLLRQVSRAIFGDDQHLELRVVTEADAPALLQQGGVDVVAREMTMTCAARAGVDFSEEYFQASERVLVARNSPARGIEDLRGKQVCAAAGSLALATVSAAASHPIPVAAPDWNECMVRFQQAEVDAIAADDVTLLGFTRQDPYARIVGDSLADEHYGIAVAKGHSDLVRFLNGALEQMRADGRWTTLATRWLGRFGPVPRQPPARYSN
jgi:polar amino acid transport system substrate-binding protein